MRSGCLVNNLQGESLYKSFKPSALPPQPELEMDSEFIKKLIEANKALSSLNTASKLVFHLEIIWTIAIYKSCGNSSISR